MSTQEGRVTVLIDSPSDAYANDRLFEDDPILNRDNCLSPLHVLKDALSSRGIPIHTADFLPARQADSRVFFYWSLGRLRDFRSLSEREDVTLVAFHVTEPPVVAPAAYKALPELLRRFRNVYVYNTEGHGYERWHRANSRLKKLFFAQAHDGLVTHLWSRKRENSVVMINANKGCVNRPNELYSERIRALVALHRAGSMDLYGPGWDVRLPRDAFRLAVLYGQGHALPPLYWKHRREILSAYKGVAASKLETLGYYKLAICFENMEMPGYITEKIFDCFFAGTVPVYLGAPDITDYVPKEAFIDHRDFGSYTDLHEYLCSLPESRVVQFKEAAREFVLSERFRPFTTERFVSQVMADLAEAIPGRGTGGDEGSA